MCGGGVCGRGACVVGGMHARRVCMVGACVARGHACHARSPPPADTTRYGDTVNKRAVRNLLEYILVWECPHFFYYDNMIIGFIANEFLMSYDKYLFKDDTLLVLTLRHSLSRGNWCHWFWLGEKIENWQSLKQLLITNVFKRSVQVYVRALMERELAYVSLRLRVQNRRKKWNFPLNFRTMHKLSDLYSGIFQTQSSGCASGVDYFRNFTKLKNLNF